MKKKFKALTDFYAFTDVPMIKEGIIFEAEVIENIYFIGSWRVHESWIINWLVMVYVEEMEEQ